MSKQHSTAAPITTIVHRPDGQPNGLRILTDDTVRIAVAAFPLAGISETIGGGFATAGAYILAGEDRIYVGESGDIRRRLVEHAADPAKAFARDAYVIRASEGVLDKGAISFFQHRLTEAAEKAGLVTVVKGVAPSNVDLPEWRISSLDRLLAAAQPLLFDAGCRAFHGSPAREPLVRTAPACDGGQDDEAPAIQPDDNAGGNDAVGPEPVVHNAPVASPAEPRRVFQLAFGEQKATAIAGCRGAVVKAGSEVQRTKTGWSRRSMQNLRNEYLRTGNLLEISGRDDVWQLASDTYFVTLLHAGRFLTFSHRGLELWRERDSAA